MISQKESIRLSKLISYVLRHNPGHMNIRLDEQGWTPVNILLQQLTKEYPGFTIEILRHIVETNDKKRFTFNDDGTLIRASQGHSIEIDLHYTEQIPPELLYHGTAEENIDSIRQNGLLKMNRHHVHLSADAETAHKVGQRHGRPVVLRIQSKMMHAKGHLFYRSDNGVWLTEQVLPEFIDW